MSNIKNKAVREFEILERTVEDPIILPFKDEILALVDKFGDSGQSGGSAPYTSSAISQAVKTLCMQNTLAPLTGENDEWNNCSEMSNKPMYQNNRASAVFKDGKDGRPYYLDAIVFTGQNDSSFTSNGSVTLKNGTKIKSSQFIREFPFKPKTFYVDVIETEWNKDSNTGKLTKQEGGGWWTSVIKDEKQLEEVFEHYECPIIPIERSKKIKKIIKK